MFANNFFNTSNKDYLAEKYFYKYFNCLLLVLSLCIAISSKLHHEPWMDEWRNLYIPLQAKNLIELYNLRIYESHPYAYYLIMYVAKFFGSDYNGLFLFHYVALVVALYLFFIKSPFPSWIKILFVFSYYFVHETMVFNRQYVFIVAILFLILHLMSIGKMKNGLFLILIALLAHLQIYTWWFLLPLSYYYYYVAPNSLSTKTKMLSIGFVIVNILLSYLSVKLPEDSSTIFILHGYNKDNVLYFLRFFVHGFTASLHFLHPFKQNSFDSSLEVLIASAIIFIGSLITIQNKKIRLCYFVTFLGLAFFSHQIGACALRHTSFYFFNYLTYQWLDISINNKKRNLVYKLYPLLAIVLLCQIVEGKNIFWKEIHQPYSESQNVANLINKDSNKKTPVISYFTFAIDAPANCLKRPVTALHCMHEHMYFDLRKSECDNPKFSDHNYILNNLQKLREKYGRCYLILCKGDFTQWLTDYLQKNAIKENTKLVGDFSNAIEANENYFVFELN